MCRVFAAVLVVTAACAQAPASGPSSSSWGSGSGINGRVVAFPTCPVETEASPCPTKGVQTMVVAESSEEDRITRVQTEADGTFRMPLPPGEYLVTARPPPSNPDLVPRLATATVEPSRYVRVTVILDTRLREPLT